MSPVSKRAGRYEGFTFLRKKSIRFFGSYQGNSLSRSYFLCRNAFRSSVLLYLHLDLLSGLVEPVNLYAFFLRPNVRRGTCPMSTDSALSTVLALTPLLQWAFLVRKGCFFTLLKRKRKNMLTALRTCENQSPLNSSLLELDCLSSTAYSSKQRILCIYRISFHCIRFSPSMSLSFFPIDRGNLSLDCRGIFIWSYPNRNVHM